MDRVDEHLCRNHSTVRKCGRQGQVDTLDEELYDLANRVELATSFAGVASKLLDGLFLGPLKIVDSSRIHLVAVLLEV
jgi:hypothetical protein